MTEWWRVIRTRQGYGYVDPGTWAAWPRWIREQVRVLILCNTEAGARAEYHRLPKDWSGGQGATDAQAAL